MKIESVRETSLAPEALWEIIAGIDRYPMVRGTILSVERLYGREFAPGARFRQQWRLVTQIMTAEMTVLDVTPGAYARVLGDWDGDQFELEYLLTPHGHGTRVTLTIEVVTSGKGRFGSALTVFTGKIPPSLLKDVLERDIDDIVAAARP